MRINWKLRVKNRATLMASIAYGVAFVYMILSWFGITPSVAQEEIVQAVSLLVAFLIGIGILVDPTTDGLDDSERAMEYERPNYADDELDEECIVEEE